MKKRTDRRSRPRDAHARRLDLAALSKDVDYLAFKEELGEVLSPSERAILEAARSAEAPKPIGGGS